MSQFQANWPAIDALLEEALSLPVAEQDTWLAGLAGDRAMHRDSLRALLAHRAQVESEDFLGGGPRLAPDALIEPGRGPGAGTEVGGYRLISEIGRGGMSTVWLAERSDGLVRRRVALKLPRIVWGDAFADRLLREREILAGLEHEHVARLYDAGVDDHGRPFIAMEYVDGQLIDAFCNARSLSTRERVGLLLQVMSAVAHAHARLVVHRDLKPGNILVTQDSRVNLLDFGIAKLLEGDLTQRTHLTELSGRALTLDYASPEQIRGEPLGTGSDIYSMAVVAFELLAGRRPYRLKRGTAAELEEAITTTEVPAASACTPDRALKRQLRGDLDAILGKALRKLPEQRYPTMDAFAQDLARWLAGEPVQARPDALGYRAVKFVGRHRVPVVAGVAVAVALVAGTSVAVWQSARAHTEAVTAKAVQGFIESVFLANSGNQDDPGRARDTTARQLLDRGADRVDRELADAPAARLRLYQSMYEMYGHMALNERAVVLERRSVALATTLYGADAEPTIQSAVDLAKTLLEMGQAGEARALLLGAEQSTRRHVPSDPTLGMNIAAALSALYFNSDPAQALDWARRAARGVRGQTPTQDTINALQMLGETANITGHYEESATALDEAQAQIARQPEAGSGGLPLILATLGEVQDKLGDPAKADSTFKRALALATRVSDPYTLHIVSYRQSRHLLVNGFLKEALESTARDDAWGSSAGHDFGTIPLAIAGQHASALTAFGNPARALQVLDAMRPAWDALPPDEEAPLLACRVDALVSLGRANDAGADMERAVQLAGSHAGASEFVREVRRRYWGALGQAERSLADLQGEQRRQTSKTAALIDLRRRAEEARWIGAAGRPADEQRLAAAVLAEIEQSPLRAYARLAEADAAEALGRALQAQNKAGDAIVALDRALELERAMQDSSRSPVLRRILLALAAAHAAVGDEAGSNSAAAQAARLGQAISASPARSSRRPSRPA